MADLRQILSQGRKRIGLLVGAGAPMAIRVDATGRISEAGDSLIPGVDDLTRLVIDGLEAEEQTAALAIKAGLGDGGNIETILSRVRLLEIALGSTRVSGLDGQGYQKLGVSICKLIGSKVGAQLPTGNNPYRELVAWVGGTMRSNSVEIFCTNYDLLFEEAFESAKAPYFDGFTGGSSPFFDPVSVASDDLPPRWSRLWKIHGSLGWAIEGGCVVRGRGREASLLVYPDHLKYDLTQKQPYAALFERLKRFLLTPDSLLLTIGFSFRDRHICAVLDEALAMNANTAAFAFQYQDLEKELAARTIAYNRPNLSVYAADGAVVSGVEGMWQPGELPKNWQEVRSSFWGARPGSKNPCFLLGDFTEFARFCALTQATDFARTSGASAEQVAADPFGAPTL
jgi:SIR2-like domain